VSAPESRLVIHPAVDSDEHAAQLRAELELPRDVAAERARTTVEAVRRGFYDTPQGRRVDIGPLVATACSSTVSIPPDAPRGPAPARRFDTTVVQVVNDTTLVAARALTDAGLRPAALNFANGVRPGGGFLGGALAQEEALCRCSGLYATLVDDPMYGYHAARGLPESSDWVVLSPTVPVFRTDAGAWLDEPWLLDFLTCAAPYAPRVGQPRSGNLLRQRIERLLSVAAADGTDALVLGAWGCGVFGNDPNRTARDFRDVLEGPLGEAFRHVVFAVADWSAARRLLAPFVRAFQ
jgi:uncharacterized protein (TIGR02452 family)